MLCTMDMDYTDIRRYLKQAGIYFPLILALWLVVYMVNTLSWYLIINDEGKVKGAFLLACVQTDCERFRTQLYYALRTDGRRALPHHGAEALYGSEQGHLVGYPLCDDAHLLAFTVRFLSIFLFVAMYPVGVPMGIMLVLIGAFCLLGIYFFSRGYRTGMAQKGHPNPYAYPDGEEMGERLCGI